jgi:hypothetical protein
LVHRRAFRGGEASDGLILDGIRTALFPRIGFEDLLYAAIT